MMVTDDDDSEDVNVEDCDDNYCRDRAASFRVGGLKKNARRKIWGGGGGGGMLVDFYSISLK